MLRNPQEVKRKALNQEGRWRKITGIDRGVITVRVRISSPFLLQQSESDSDLAPSDLIRSESTVRHAEGARHRLRDLAGTNHLRPMAFATNQQCRQLITGGSWSGKSCDPVKTGKQIKNNAVL